MAGATGAVLQDSTLQLLSPSKPSPTPLMLLPQLRTAHANATAVGADAQDTAQAASVRACKEQCTAARWCERRGSGARQQATVAWQASRAAAGTVASCLAEHS